MKVIVVLLCCLLAVACTKAKCMRIRRTQWGKLKKNLSNFNFSISYKYFWCLHPCCYWMQPATEFKSNLYWFADYSMQSNIRKFHNNTIQIRAFNKKFFIPIFWFFCKLQILLVLVTPLLLAATCKWIEITYYKEIKEKIEAPFFFFGLFIKKL